MKNIVFDHNTDGVFSMHVIIATGSVNESKGIRGISHLLEHMLFKSKKHMGTEQLLSKLNAIGGTFNAATNKDWTMYFIKTTSDQWSRCIDLLHTIVFEAKFIDSELRKERRVVVEELLQSKDDSSDVVIELAYKSFLKKDNKFRQSVIGKIKDIMGASPKDLEAYYQAHYKNNKHVLIHVGCPIQIHADVKTAVMHRFRHVVVDFKPMLPSWTGCLPSGVVNVVHQPSWSQNATCIMFESFPFRDQRNVVLEYLWDVLVGGLNSLLMMEMREKRGYVYSISSFVDAYADGGVTGIIFTSSNDALDTIVAYIFKVLRSLKSTGLSAGILKYTKASYLNRLKYRMTDRDYKEEKKMWQLFYGVSQTEQAEFKKISRITNEDIKTVSTVVFRADKVAITSGGRYEDVDATRNAVSRILHTSIGGSSG